MAIDEAIGVSHSDSETSTFEKYRIPVVRVMLVREGSLPASPFERSRIRSATDIVREFEYLKAADREHFVVLMLDVKNRIIGLHEVSIGSLSAALVHPREVFKAAFLMNAAAICLLHNHPSGDPFPSAEDRELTMRLCEGAKLLGIPVIDHVVIGAEGYYSFAEKGLMPNSALRRDAQGLSS